MMIVSSCSTILVNTTNREGMQENPARRTPGAIVEDQSIETIIAVNLKADSLAFRETRFNVVSHNGVVLLVGQVESGSMKQKATEIISKASSKIKRVHNELEITEKKPINSPSAPFGNIVAYTLRLTDWSPPIPIPTTTPKRMTGKSCSAGTK